MPLNQKSMIMILIINLLEQLCWTFLADDEDEFEFEFQSNEQGWQIGANFPPQDIYNDIKGTIFFPHHANCNEKMFEYIKNGMGNVITQSRNNKFVYSRQQNLLRRRRKNKITVENRILEFLHQHGEQTKVWESAFHNGWNPSSVSRDYKHCLIHFVATFNGWIRPLTDAQKRDCRVYENYPTVFCGIDGSMFQRRITHKLPNHISRRDYYDHKSKYGESQNVQAVATKANITTHLTTGIPGAMCDSNACRYIAVNEWDRGILSDSGYPQERRFVRSDGTMEHKQERAHIEHLFHQVKGDWEMVGGVYNRDSKYHSLAIRAAFILNNMKKSFGTNFNPTN
eukprot:406389_1